MKTSITIKKYKFAFNYNNIVKYIELDQGTEIGVLKWNLISQLPKSLKQNNPMFTFLGKSFTDNEYEAIDSIFKDNDTNEIQCEFGHSDHVILQSYEKGGLTSKSDITINSQFIINSLINVENSPYYHFFTNYKKDFIPLIDAKYIQMKKDIDKTLEEFIMKSKQSLIELINIKQYELLQEGIGVIKGNLGKVLKDSNTIENLFNVYEESMMEYKKIMGLSKMLSRRYDDLIFANHCINESVNHMTKMTQGYMQCYDYETFIPYGDNSNEKGGKDVLGQGFTFDLFIKDKPVVKEEIPYEIISKEEDNNTNDFVINSSEAFLPSTQVNKGKPISEKDIQYAEKLNINTFIEKVEEITFLRIERVSKIKKRFEAINDEIKKIQEKLITHFNHPEEEQQYLSQITQKVKEVNNLIATKMTFEERKEKEVILLNRIKEIKAIDKKIKKKYDETLYDSKIMEIILNCTTTNFMSHINTQYDCLTDLSKIKKIVDYNSIILTSNSKIELWKKCIDFRNNDLLQSHSSINASIASNPNQKDLNNNPYQSPLLNEQIIELLHSIPTKLEEINQRIDNHTKATEVFKKLTNETKAISSRLQTQSSQLSQVLDNTSFIPGIVSNSIHNSNILRSKEETYWVCSLFPSVTKYKMVYQATRDGCLSNDFHRKCDRIGNSLVVIESCNGFKFGGFTSKSWTIVNQKIKQGEDMKAFIFSVTMMKRYEIGNKKTAVYSSDEHLCCFGNEIAILNNCLEREDNYNMTPEQLLNEYDEVEDEGKEIIEINGYLAGKKLFQVTEMEVYQVILKETDIHDNTEVTEDILL